MITDQKFRAESPNLHQHNLGTCLQNIKHGVIDLCLQCHMSLRSFTWGRPRGVNVSSVFRCLLDYLRFCYYFTNTYLYVYFYFDQHMKSLDVYLIYSVINVILLHYCPRVTWLYIIWAIKGRHRLFHSLLAQFVCRWDCATDYHWPMINGRESQWFHDPQYNAAYPESCVVVATLQSII